MDEVFVKHSSFFIDVLLESFFGPPAVAGRVYKIGSVRPSAFLSFRLSGHFLWIVSLTFCKFWHGARNSYEVVRDRAWFSRKIFFVPKMGELGQKQGFLNLLKNWVIIFFWIWSIKKFYNIYCILAQIPYLGKFWFLRYRPKCSWPVRLQYF